ncbi:MAG: UDP-N-acetylmuramoyl-tripeptide--D-alanyl-D-alanine ligase [Deltaproteobacteria bacterium]|nr:UDP-N-acetylmuramoyl-tripeptide--D-alanyl-D-alanine ligase [Deltaproteobacteria bacterium]
MDISVNEIVKAVGGALISGDGNVRVKGVSTDSRKASRGEVFFALKGPNFDAHRFVADVLKNGALAVVLEDEKAASGLSSPANIIKVKDTLAALGALAAYIRGLYKTPLIAISGSAGKTTTKEMVASILARSRKVLKTEGNRNNLVGLPLTLFGLEKSHEAAVIELGISEFWEMERLVNICRPDVAVITNIGRGHLKTLGSLEGVARAKGPLFTEIGEDKTRVVNLDDPLVVKTAGGRGNIITYSLKEPADVRLREYKIDEGFGGMGALYEVRGKDVSVRFNAPGVTNIPNGAAAIAAALPLSPSVKDIEDGLSSFAPVHGRMEVLKLGDLTVIDDTYNANPESMSSALRTLEKAEGRTVAILGDMLELGDVSSHEHREIGRLAGRLGIDVVVAIGEWSMDVVDGVFAGGEDGAVGFKDKKEAIGALKRILRKGDSILVKGSRSVGLEDVVEGIKIIAGCKTAC